MSDLSTVSRNLLIAAGVVPATCALLIIICIIAYLIMKRRKASTVAIDSSPSSFYEDSSHGNELTLTKTIVPLNGSMKDAPMSPRRAQSVEYTFFNESGDVDEIQFYDDVQGSNRYLNEADDGMYLASDEGTPEVFSSEGNTNMAFSAQDERDGQSFNSEPEEDDTYLNPNITPIENTYLEANITPIEHTYLRPDTHVKNVHPTRPPTLADEDDYVLPDPPQPSLITDGEDDYVLPDPPKLPVDNDDGESDYALPDNSTGDDDNLYVKPDPPKQDPRRPEPTTVSEQQPEYANIKLKK